MSAVLQTPNDESPATYDWQHFWSTHNLTAAGAILGLLLVIWAAVLVILENRGLQRIINQDLSDLPHRVERARDGHKSPSLDQR